MPIIPHHTLTKNLRLKLLYTTSCGLCDQECRFLLFVDTIIVKTSLIHEESVIHKLWLSFQPSPKIHGLYDLAQAAALFGCGRGKDHHCTKSSILVTMEYCSSYVCTWTLLNSTKHTALLVILLCTL